MARPATIVGILLTACTSASAQARDASRSLRLAVENDLIAVRGAGAPPDYDYTHGTRLGAAWPGAPHWVRRLAGGKPSCTTAAARERGCVATGLELGQEIYTPRRDAPVPIAGERPYAGWLYASGAAHLVSARRIRSARVTLGVTGPPSLAAETQNGLHRVLGNEPQLGWAHQVSFEPGVTLRYDERLSGDRTLGGAGVARVGATWGATAGNVRTALHAGATARIGVRSRSPWVPLDPEPHDAMSAYVLTGYLQELVLRDLFVEGNTLRASAGAARRAWVAQYEVGVGFRRRDYAIEYRHVTRGREYRAQPRPHAYGVATLVLHQF